MKNAIKILVSVLVSLLIVYVGGGVAIVRCMQTDEASVADYAMRDCGCCNKKGCSKKLPSCMKLSIQKLSPTELQQQHFDKSGVSMIQSVALPVVYLWHFLTTDGDASHYFMRWKIPSPPRLYLSRICVLII